MKIKCKSAQDKVRIFKKIYTTDRSSSYQFVNGKRNAIAGNMISAFYNENCEIEIFSQLDKKELKEKLNLSKYEIEEEE